jgi:hypothetical protein
MTRRPSGGLHQGRAGACIIRNRIQLENIEEIRCREGIEDVELREAIGGLAIGDVVKVTLLAGPHSLETLPVRITSIKGSVFRGKLAKRPASPSLASLRAGSLLAFTAAHIHSLARG